MNAKPEGEGWVEVPLVGGPKDGDRTFYKPAPGRKPSEDPPQSEIRFVEGSSPSLHGRPIVKGEMLHVYRAVAKGEAFLYLYVGTQQAE